MSGGTNARRHRMRCSQGSGGCGRRFTLTKPPNEFKKYVVCPHCKCTNVKSVERMRQLTQSRKNTCRCDRYPFPHEAGSLRMCECHPDFEKEPTDEEKEQYQQCLDTPRSMTF